MQKAKKDWLGRGLVIFFLALLFALTRGHPDMLWHAKEFTARHDVDELACALNAYYREYGVMPEGGNAEILAALQRKNPKDIMFFKLGSKHMNSKGELLDPWGTSYRIGHTKAGYPWAYSFGANKIDDGGAMGTDDISSWQ